MSDTLIPMMGKGIDPWQAYKDYYGAAASQYAPAQAGANVAQTQATTGKIGAETATEQQRPAMVQAQAGLAGAQAGLAGTQAGREQAQTSYIGGPQTAETYAHAGLLGTQAGKTVAETGMVRAQERTEGMRPGLVGAQTNKTGAEALLEGARLPLVGEQVIGAHLGNVGLGYTTGIRGQQYEDIMKSGGSGTPEQQQTLPWNGGTPPDTSGGIAGAAPAAPFVSPNGSMVFTGPEAPIPKQIAWQIAQSQDQNKARMEALAQRDATLKGLVARSMNPDGTVNSDLWNQNMRIGYEAGFLNDQQVQQWYKHSERSGAVMNTLVAPGEQPGVVGAASAARAGAQTPYELVDVNVKNPDGSVTPTQMPKDQALKAVRAGTATSNTPVPGFTQVITPDGQAFQPSAFSLAMNKIENPGGNPAQANTSGPGGSRASSATGNNQFTDTTWLEQARKFYPDASNAELMKLRTNSNLPFAATDAYALQNAAGIQKFYPGQQIPTAAIGLAHLLGPGGFEKFAAVPDSGVMLRDVLPTVAEKNPNLAGKTVQEVANMYKDAFANVPPPTMPVLGPLPGTPAAVAIGQGITKLTPQQQADIDIAKQKAEVLNQASAKEAAGSAEAYGERSGAIVKSAASAPTKMVQLATLENAAEEFRTGTTGPMRLAAQGRLVDGLKLFGITPPEWMTNRVAAGETIGKEGGYLAAEMTRALGSREAASVFNQVRDIQPNIRLSEGGYANLVASIKQGIVRDQDIGVFREQWLSNPANNNSIAGMERAFNQDHPIEAYASRIVPYPFPAGGKGLKQNVIYRLGNGAKAIFDGAVVHELAAK